MADVEIIYEKPDDATRELREKLGFVEVSIWTGQRAWVHRSKLPEMTDKDAAEMVRDLNDEEWQQKMRQKFGLG